VSAAAQLAVLLGAIVTAFGLGCRQGGLGCRLADARAAHVQEAKIAARAVTDRAIVAEEARTYAKSRIDPVVSPVVRVCHYTPVALPGASAPTPRIDGAVDERVPHSVPARDPDPGPNFGPPLVRAGHVCDAQVAALQDYVRRVCLVPP
jgi:hypothetical protein